MRFHFNDLPRPVRERLHRIAMASGDPLLAARGLGQVGRGFPWVLAAAGVSAFAYFVNGAIEAASPFVDLFALAGASGLLGLGLAAHLALGRLWPSSPFDGHDQWIIGVHAISTFDGSLEVLPLAEVDRIEVETIQARRARLVQLRVSCGAASMTVPMGDHREAERARARAIELVQRYRHARAAGDAQRMAEIDALWELARGFRDGPDDRSRGPRVSRRPAWAYLLAVLLGVAATAAVLVPLWHAAAERSAARSRVPR